MAGPVQSFTFATTLTLHSFAQFRTLFSLTSSSLRLFGGHRTLSASTLPSLFLSAAVPASVFFFPSLSSLQFCFYSPSPLAFREIAGAKLVRGPWRDAVYRTILLLLNSSYPFPPPPPAPPHRFPANSLSAPSIRL